MFKIVYYMLSENVRRVTYFYFVLEIKINLLTSVNEK